MFVLSHCFSSVPPSRRRNGTRVNIAAELACTGEHTYTYESRHTTSAEISFIYPLGSRPVCRPFTRNTLYITIIYSRACAGVHTELMATICFPVDEFFEKKIPHANTNGMQILFVSFLEMRCLLTAKWLLSLRFIKRVLAEWASITSTRCSV